MRRPLIIGALTLLLLPAGSSAMDMAMGTDSEVTHASILFGSVTPPTVDVLAGQSVDWSNDSIRNHTVTADDGSFNSGTLSPNAHFKRMFDAVGDFGYHCSLHPYIRGTVEVRRLLLTRPVQPAAAGKTYPLQGEAALPADTPVSIEFDSGDGWGFYPVAQTTVGPDGHFTVPLTPSASGSYRAVSGEDQSPPVNLVVLNRSISARASGNRVSASVSPASPGATVVLQEYLKERFGWWPVAQKKLDKSSRATFTVRHHPAVSARVVLTLPDGATVLATSNKLRLHAAR